MNLRKRSVPLSTLPNGSRAVVVRTHSRLEGVVCPAMMERLGAMGFVPGVRLVVEANYGTGPVIVRIKGARVAIGRGQAMRLMVQTEEPRGEPRGAGTGGGPRRNRFGARGSEE